MKKNSRGFTLIEIIGVITVLSIILVFSVPALTKTLKVNEQKKYDDYIDNLKIVTENYVVGKLKEGQFFEDSKDYNYVSLGNLIDSGYIKNTITNPENDKELSRDTRIKVYKEADGTYSYDVQEYYNTTDDYNKDNLIIHYDAVEYSKDNIFKSLTNEVDYDYSTAAEWTEDGVLFDKAKNATGILKLNNSYSTDQITVSFNIKTIDQLSNSTYTYPLTLYQKSDGVPNLTFGVRDRIFLFYYSGNNTVMVGQNIIKNNNYTITYVQEDLTTRKVYINGKLASTKTDLELSTILYSYMKISPRSYNLNINNMLVYNRALNVGEVQELYQLDTERFGE